MKEPSPALYILFRKPRLPSIIVSKDKLFAGTDRATLTTALLASVPHEADNPHVLVIDSSGAEFRYIPDRFALMPGICVRNWSKKAIIDLFNSSSNAKLLGVEGPARSLSNTSVAEVVGTIAGLLRQRT